MGPKLGALVEKMGRSDILFQFFAATPMVIEYCHSETINSIQKQPQAIVYLFWFQYHYTDRLLDIMFDWEFIYDIKVDIRC